MSDEKTVNILGTEWRLILGSSEQYPVLKEADGYTDSSTHEIIIDRLDDCAGEPDCKGNLEGYRNEVIRHEIVHAYLYESGLAANSNGVECWANNEEMVDWIALQAPKLFRTYQEVGAL